MPVADVRAAFIDWMFDLLGDGDLPRFLQWVLTERVDDGFFTAPASSTGKFHPPFDQGEGGLVRHVVCCAEMARELLRLFQVEDNRQKQVILAAAVMHDAWKNTMADGEWGPATTRDHGEVAGRQLVAAWKDYAPDHVTAAAVESMVRLVAAACRSHMVQWAADGTVPFPGAPLTVQVLATADYVSSRKAWTGWSTIPSRLASVGGEGA